MVVVKGQRGSHLCTITEEGEYGQNTKYYRENCPWSTYECSIGNRKYKETSLTQMEVPCWSYQLGKWIGVKMKEPEYKGLVIEYAKRKSKTLWFLSKKRARIEICSRKKNQY